jgi:Na+/H+ antiporter NhaD/arsenite permease-like protein
MAAILGLVVGAALGANIGVVALAAAAVLFLLAPHQHAKAFDEIGWSSIMLVCGMLTLMSVLTANGTVDYIDAAAAIGNPQIAVLLILFVVGLLSAVGSSIGTIGIALPLAFPLLADGGCPRRGSSWPSPSAR